jgi:protein SCO1/2
LLAGGIAAWLYTQPGSPATTTVGGVGEALIGGRFELVDQHGDTRTSADFRGSYMLVYFGFTYCPDVCPTTLQVMTQALEVFEERAPEKAGRVVPMFITVDPERDTVGVLGDYAEHFHPRLVALTGAPDQVAEAAKAYRVYYAKAGNGSDYLVDHSSFTYLMGPDGKYVAHFGHGTPPDEMAQKLERLVKSP